MSELFTKADVEKVDDIRNYYVEQFIDMKETLLTGAQFTATYALERGLLDEDRVDEVCAAAILAYGDILAATGEIGVMPLTEKALNE